MMGAGLLAKKAVERGLTVKPWVKTSLAPGSKVVTAYLKRAGLTDVSRTAALQPGRLRLHDLYRQQRPVAEPIAGAVKQGNLVASAILSGNRNFEGRINPVVRFNYLASPPLVVAYAIAGTMDFDAERRTAGHATPTATPVFLRDIWPTPRRRLAAAMAGAVDSAMFRKRVRPACSRATSAGAGSRCPRAICSAGRSIRSYVKAPPFFDGVGPTPAPVSDIKGARVLAMLGDSVTTDHISPAGSIAADGPAGQYLIAHGVQPQDFNSYGARRGNHEVMVRGTFANIRLRTCWCPASKAASRRICPTARSPRSSRRPSNTRKKACR